MSEPKEEGAAAEAPTEESMELFAEIAQRLVVEHKTVQVTSVVMMCAWRLFYCARNVLESFVTDNEELSEEERQGAITILLDSVSARALGPYEIKELTRDVEMTCLSFLTACKDVTEADLEELAAVEAKAKED